jgi:hypothetical protein
MRLREKESVRVWTVVCVRTCVCVCARLCLCLCLCVCVFASLSGTIVLFLSTSFSMTRLKLPSRQPHHCRQHLLCRDGQYQWRLRRQWLRQPF